MSLVKLLLFFCLFVPWNEKYLLLFHIDDDDDKYDDDDDDGDHKSSEPGRHLITPLGNFSLFCSGNRKFCRSRWVVIWSIWVLPALEQRWPPNNISTLVLSVLVLCLDVLPAGMAEPPCGFFYSWNCPAVGQERQSHLSETICQNTQADRTQRKSMFHQCVGPLNDHLCGFHRKQGETLTLFTTEKRIIRIVDSFSNGSDCSRWLMSSSPSVSACSVAVDQRNYAVYFCLLPNLECCVFVFSLNVLLSVGRENIARQQICAPENILMSSGGCQQVGAHWARLYPREKFYGSGVSLYLPLFRSLLMELNWIKLS